MTNPYHYTESGLDNVWLHGGFKYVTRPSGKAVKITDLEGLHKEIGRVLTEKKGDLSGKEIRFLRQEMLMSQSLLATLLQVAEQTVHRWETGKVDVPKTAETLIRILYRQQFLTTDDKLNLRQQLEKLADMEDELDKLTFSVDRQDQSWQLKAA